MALCLWVSPGCVLPGISASPWGRKRSGWRCSPGRWCSWSWGGRRGSAPPLSGLLPRPALLTSWQSTGSAGNCGKGDIRGIAMGGGGGEGTPTNSQWPRGAPHETELKLEQCGRGKIIKNISWCDTFVKSSGIYFCKNNNLSIVMNWSQERFIKIQQNIKLLETEKFPSQRDDSYFENACDI